MKKTITAILASCMMLTSCSVMQNLDYGRLMEGGAKIMQSMTITNAEMQDYVKSYVAQMDAQNTILGSNSPYIRGLNRIVSGITSVEGTP